MYRVRWERRALDELARLWLQSDTAQRQELTAATNRIDEFLQIDPRNAGESRAGLRRITFVPPLAVIFRVESAADVVSVLHVQMFQRKQG